MHTYVLEQTQHLIVCGVIGQEEGQVRISEDGGNTDETSATTGDDGHVLPGILALLILTMVLVVEVGNGLPQRSDTGRRTIFASGNGDVNGFGALEAASDVVLDLRSTLAQVCPGVGVFEEAVFGSTLSAPDYTGGRSAGVEARVGHVTLVGITELAMNLGLNLCILSVSAQMFWPEAKSCAPSFGACCSAGAFRTGRLNAGCMAGKTSPWGEGEEGGEGGGKLNQCGYNCGGGVVRKSLQGKKGGLQSLRQAKHQAKACAVEPTDDACVKRGLFFSSYPICLFFFSFFSPFFACSILHAVGRREGSVKKKKKKDTSAAKTPRKADVEMG